MTLLAGFLGLKRIRAFYQGIIQAFAERSLCLQGLPFQMSFCYKLFKVGRGASYDPKSILKNWLKNKMKRFRHVPNLLAKEWKSNKQETQTQGIQHSDQSPQASTWNDVKTLIKKCGSVRNFEKFQWFHHRKEVLCFAGSFSLLLLGVLFIHLVTGAFRLSVSVPWIFTGSIFVLVFSQLFLCYKESQMACSYVLSIIFLLISILWCMDDFSSKIPAPERLSGSMSRWNPQYIDFYVLIGLPCALSHSLYLTAKGSYFWILGLPCLFFFTLAIHSFMASYLFAPQAFYVLEVTFFFTFITLFIAYLGRDSDKRLYARIRALEESLSQSKLKEREAIQAFEQSKAKCEERMGHLKQFIGFIFHELRVPFNGVVLGIGHMLASSLSDEHREILKMMETSSSSVIHILNDMLDVGKIEAGKFQFEEQPFNMGELVSSLIWSFKDVFDSKGIGFFLHVDHPTKWLLSHHELIGDKHRVCQVLANYLSNAAKFTPHNGKVGIRVVSNGTFTEDLSLSKHPELIPLEVEQKCKFCSWYGKEKEGADNHKTFVSLTLSVEDTGIGISDEDKVRLFEPYSQLKAGSVHGGGGTGLGLCLSKMIVELAGGTVGVHSEVGKGSTFSFTMPFELGKFISENGEAEINPFEFQTVRGELARTVSMNKYADFSLIDNKPKVLIVEDNQVNRVILRKLLSSFNLDTNDVENGKQAVEMCRNGGSYDMIMMDKEMPVMDGLEATRELRSMGIEIPIVGLSGNSLLGSRKQFLDAGVDQVLIKPVSRNQLVRLLEAHNLITRARK